MSPFSSRPPRRNLDEQFEQQSARCGIGVAKLKAIYFRGVREFQQSDTGLGTATIWGLARVQRFINGDITADADMIATQLIAPATDPGVEMTSESGSFLSDILYASGEGTAELFRPGVVVAMQIEDQTLTVEGTLDGRDWIYFLDTISGHHTLLMQ